MSKYQTTNERISWRGALRGIIITAAASWGALCYISPPEDPGLQDLSGSSGHLQMEYDPATARGTGIDSLTAKVKANPFDGEEGPMTEVAAQSLSDEITARFVDSATAMATAVQTGFGVDYAGWGAEVQADLAYESRASLDVQQVKFLASRVIDYGFYGWLQPPPLSAQAKGVLCESGSAQFAQYYGTHYVAGELRGASITIDVTLTLEASTSAETIGAALSGSFDAYGGSASANAEFQSQISATEGISRQEVFIATTGADLGRGVGSLTIEDAGGELLGFAEYATSGTGRALVLKKYENHPDYIAVGTDGDCTELHGLLPDVDQDVQNWLYRELYVLYVLDDYLYEDEYLTAEEVEEFYARVEDEEDQIFEYLAQEEISRRDKKAIKRDIRGHAQGITNEYLEKVKDIIMRCYLDETENIQLYVAYGDGDWQDFKYKDSTNEYLLCGINPKIRTAQVSGWSMDYIDYYGAGLKLMFCNKKNWYE